MFKYKTNKISGITLIALVITIIALLILAGISIMMVSGNNGILTRAKDAKEQMALVQEKEYLMQAYISASAKNKRGDVTAKSLQKELDAIMGDTEKTNEIKIKQNSNNTLTVLFENTKNNYNIDLDDGKIIETIEDGIYVGNVIMGGLYLPDVNNMSYEDYQSSISDEEVIISTFFRKCYEKTATNSEYKDALESAEKFGISREWIDYAYNNQGDRIRNIQVSSYIIELTSPNRTRWDTRIPLTADITSFDKNFDFSLNIDIYYTVFLERDAETGALYSYYEYVPMNPEAISFCYIDPNQEIQEEVQLPFGMVLKHVEDPYTAEYFINNWGYTREEATQEANNCNDGVAGDCVIEWQGQTFNVFELRDYINNNIKIVYNGQTVNITSSTSGEELDNLFGISAEDLYSDGYLDELNW